MFGILDTVFFSSMTMLAILALLSVLLKDERRSKKIRRKTVLYLIGILVLANLVLGLFVLASTILIHIARFLFIIVVIKLVYALYKL